MPVFRNPRLVVVDEGGGAGAAIAAVIGVAVVVSAAGALIADLVTAILICAVVAVLGSLGVLAVVLRRGRGRTGLYAPESDRPAAPTQPAVLEAARPPAIETARQSLPFRLTRLGNDGKVER
jgi:hypothetical protein